MTIYYKGFAADWSCRGFSYGKPEGQTFTYDGEVSLCHFGFHACEAPLDIWTFYPPVDGNQAAQVALEKVSDERGNATKRVGRSITLKASLSVAALIAAQIEWTFNEAKKGQGKTSNGDYSTAVSSGDHSMAASSGYSSKAASRGYSSKAASRGYSSMAASSGYSSKAASSGNYSKAASSGDYSTAASSGHHSTAASSGLSSTAASSGYSSKAASSGLSSTAASSGHHSTAASSGDHSMAASSGKNSKTASSGNYSTAASSGDSSKVSCDSNGFACVAGFNSKVKGKAGSALSLGYKDTNGRNRIAVCYVGENGIKEDTWYAVDNFGKFYT